MALKPIINRKRSGSNIFFVGTIVFMMVLPAFSMVSVSDIDPTITTTGAEYEAVWDFSDIYSYTLENTSIDAGQLKLGQKPYTMVDDTAVDFKAGSAFQVRVTPDGSVVLANKNGTGFTDVAAQANLLSVSNGLSTSWGDYDNDMDQDIFVGSADQRNYLFRNKGDGTFDEIAFGAKINGTMGLTSFYSYGAVWGDYNNDGYLDLAQNINSNNRLWKNNKDGTFTDITNSALFGYDMTRGMVWLDFNHDGNLDIYTSKGSSASRLMKNMGDGTFTDVGVAAGVNDGCGGSNNTVTDINGDGWDDIVKNCLDTNVILYINNKDGTFSDKTGSWNLTGMIPSLSSALSADFNNDGKMDLYWPLAGQDSLWINKGSEFWNLTTQSGLTDNRRAWGGAIADFNLDGYPDIFVANNNSRSYLWMNDGDGTFTDKATDWNLPSTSARSVAWADYDNDGDPDLYSSNFGQSSLYRNNENSDDMLKVRLVGNTSNKAVIGAKIELYAKGSPDTLEGIRMVGSGSGLGSTQSLEQVFGAKASVLHKAIVKFPGGKTVTIDDIQVPASLLVNESGAVKYLGLDHHYCAGGNFTSRAFNVGNIVSWGALKWDIELDPKTNFFLRTRTSPDGSTWSAWSDPYYVNGEDIKSSNDKYIQYWVEFKSSDPNANLRLNNVTISFYKYVGQGNAWIKVFNFNQTGLKVRFTSAGTSNGQSISYSYSKDGAKTWKDMPVDGNLSTESFNNISLRIELITADDMISPSVQQMKLRYYLNRAPLINLVSPVKNGLSGIDEELKWNASDPDGHSMKFDVYVGTSQPYPKVASDIVAKSYLVKGLKPGRTYFWYVVAKDVHGATNTSKTWSFIANSPPEIDLVAPWDGSKQIVTKIKFRWIGLDNEGQPMTFAMFYEKDGQLFKGVSDTNRSEITINLENKKTYKWYVVANDTHLSNRSTIWSFSIDAPINHLPTINATPPATAVVGKPLSFNLEIKDLDNDKVLPSFIAGVPIPPGMTITSTGQIMWTPTTTGIFLIGILLDDGKDEVRYYFNITVSSSPPNMPPKFITIPAQKLKSTPITIKVDEYVTDDGGPSQIYFSLGPPTSTYFTATIDGSKLTLTPTKNTKGTGNISIIASDSQNAKSQFILNVTVDNKVVEKPDILSTLCSLWPIFLIVLILVVLAIVVTVVIKRADRPKKRPAGATTEKFETWDQMQGELYAEKKKEDEDGPKFRGVGRFKDDEIMEIDDPRSQQSQYYAPEPDPEVYSEPSYYKPAPGPVFVPLNQPVRPPEVAEEPEETPQNVWTPAGSPEKVKVFTDEKAQKAQQDAEIDDILSKLKSNDDENPKKKETSRSKDPSLDELLSKLKKK